MIIPWINKYVPVNILDIIGNKNQINILTEWLINIDNNTSKNYSIIISGNQGLGKTTTIELILKHFNYIIKIIKPNEIKDHRIYEEINDYYDFKNSIYAKLAFNNNKNKKIAIIFDETENITLSSEKKYIMDIYKKNNKLKAFPLIFISNNHHSKLLYDLKKECSELIFINPTNTELKDYIIKIYDKENIILENYTSMIDKIIDFSQYDFRRLINILQELVYHISNNILTEFILDEYIITSKKKNIDIGLFKSTKTLFNKYLKYNDIMRLYQIEKVLLPLMVHENYIKKIVLNNNKSIKSIMDDLFKISISLSKADNIETSIYTDQNWYLQSIHGFFSCIEPSYLLNNNNINKIKLDDIKFSGDLNKSSLKNINKKNITNLSKIINNKNISEILMLNKISNFLITNNKEDLLISILKKYNNSLNIKDLELCLKIDKTAFITNLILKDKKRIIKKLIIK